MAIELVGFNPQNIVKVGKLERKRSRLLPGRTSQGNRISSFFNRAGRKIFTQSGVSLKKLGNKTANAFQPLFRPSFGHKNSFHLYVKDEDIQFLEEENVAIKQSISGIDLQRLTRRTSDHPVSSIDAILPNVGIIFSSTVGSSESAIPRVQPTKLPLIKRFSHDAEVIFDALTSPIFTPTSPNSESVKSSLSQSTLPQQIVLPAIQVDNGIEEVMEGQSGIFHARSASVLADSMSSQNEDQSGIPSTPKSGHIPNSKSENSIGQGPIGSTTPRNEGGEKFLQKLSSGGNRLIGITTGSFRKIGSQVQNLSSRSGSLSKRPAVHVDNFQQFRDRLTNTKSVVILL